MINITGGLTMTTRERVKKLLNFEPVDAFPKIEWAAWWNKTVERWQQEGLSEEMNYTEILEYFGMDNLICIGVGPKFPEKIHIGDGHVHSMEEYLMWREELYSDQIIENFVQRARELKPLHDEGKIAIRVWLDGFFWFPRRLFGIEEHLYAFYDEPELMHMMNQDLLEFNIKAIRALYQVLVPEFVGMAEDMSYNKGPMLSKACFDEFVAPYYKQLVPKLRERGIRVLIDTDGDVEPLIPWFKECGIQGVIPLERQSQVDVARIREKYPEWIMIGGYDKTIMHLGEEAMRKEFERLLPTMKKGRYIPAVDHQTPPDVNMENYRTYVRLSAEYMKKAAE